MIQYKNALIIFVKNPIIGKVKTRLASSIGPEHALQVYKQLLRISELETSKIKNIAIHVFFSENIDETLWKNAQKHVQVGQHLGEKMFHAFSTCFQQGYSKICIIGSDLPELNSSLIHQAFDKLNVTDVVIGPANDGGYYLLGLNYLISSLFENKSWSTPNLLQQTCHELNNQNISYHLLEPLSDLDNIEDYHQFRKKGIIK